MNKIDKEILEPFLTNVIQSQVIDGFHSASCAMLNAQIFKKINKETLEPFITNVLQSQVIDGVSFCQLHHVRYLDIQQNR